MTAYINFKAFPYIDPRDQHQTAMVESKDAPLWWQTQGLSYTATGYGKRIPTRHMVRWQGKWRRVYVCQYSNAGTSYIGKLSDGLTISHIEW